MIHQTVKAARSTWGSIRRKRISRSRALSGVGVLGALVLCYSLSTHFYVHQQLYQYGRNWLEGNAAREENIWLPDFHVVIDAKPIDPDLTNLSGVTYDYDNDRLLAVTNKGPMQLLTMDKNGTISGRYPLIGFDDTEGLAYLGNGRVALCDDELQQLDIITLPTQPRPILAEEAEFIALLINPDSNNKGFEGVTYDPVHDRLFAIKERNPRQLFEVSGVMRSIDQGRLQIKITDRIDWVEHNVFARDLSDGYYDPRTGNLLLLSDQSRSITELDRDGRFVSFRSLLGGISGLRHSAPQPEGITMDRDGNLYVVSEPNLFYKLSKASSE